MTHLPGTVLQTETAIQVALWIQGAGYAVQATPRNNGCDLAAERHGTVWATFHVDVDARRPLFLRVGATVWGGARVSANAEVAWDAKPGETIAEFVRNRLDLACRRGREESPDHCDDCPIEAHREIPNA